MPSAWRRWHSPCWKPRGFRGERSVRRWRMMDAIAGRPEGAREIALRRNFFVRALAGLGRRATLSILIYHRVLQQQDPLRPGEPTAAEFESRMRWIKSNFDLVPLADGVAGL